MSIKTVYPFLDLRGQVIARVACDLSDPKIISGVRNYSDENTIGFIVKLKPGVVGMTKILRKEGELILLALTKRIVAMENPEDRIADWEMKDPITKLYSFDQECRVLRSRLKAHERNKGWWFE